MQKNDSGFTVTDRRKFTSEGEARAENETRQEEPKQTTEQQAPAEQSVAPQQEVPLPPSADEQQHQADAYRENSKKLDEQLDAELERQGHTRRAQDFEISFEKFVASLYMTALMQLGLVREEGMQPTADLIGARQTIDTIALLSEKTKGNLSPSENNMLQNCLYELRMAYLEITNALTRPQAGGIVDPGATQK
jgi:hypothetical protein